jgi:hypothetical protein
MLQGWVAARNSLPRGSLLPGKEDENMIRLLLLVAIIALAADAIANNGAYTQAAWRQLSAYTVKLVGPEHDDAGVPAENRS